MEAKHTPGPWLYGVRPDGSIWLSLGDHKTGPHYQGDLVATPADARLIAATPELLAAAKQAEKWIAIRMADDGWPADRLANPPEGSHLFNLRSAIASAESDALALTPSRPKEPGFPLQGLHVRSRD